MKKSDWVVDDANSSSFSWAVEKVNRELTTLWISAKASSTTVVTGAVASGSGSGSGATTAPPPVSAGAAVEATGIAMTSNPPVVLL